MSHIFCTEKSQSMSASSRLSFRVVCALFFSVSSEGEPQARIHTASMRSSIFSRSRDLVGGDICITSPATPVLMFLSVTMERNLVVLVAASRARLPSRQQIPLLSNSPSSTRRMMTESNLTSRILLQAFGAVGFIAILSLDLALVIPLRVNTKVGNYVLLKF